MTTYDAPSLDVIISELTGGLRKKWPRAKDFPSSELSVKHSILHKIAIKNWLPSSHRGGVRKKLATFLYTIGTKAPFNLGELMFEQVCRHEGSQAVELPLGYPSFIFDILMSQKNIVGSSDKYGDDPKEIILGHKLFEGNHVPDIEREQELSDSGGEENAGEATAPHGVLKRAPVRVRTISDAIQERMVQ